MKLNVKSKDFAMDMINQKKVSVDKWEDDASEVDEKCYLGKDDDTGAMDFQFSKAGNLYSQSFKSISLRAKEQGKEDIALAANELDEMCSKSFPELKEPAKKWHKNISIIKDKSFIALLDKNLTKTDKTDKDGSNDGFWALASVEDPAGDSDGDIIVVDGITSDIDAENGKYLPLLPGHQKRLPDGKSPEIGRVEKLVKTTYNNMPALATYSTWALNDDGTPMDELVASYYKRWKKGYLNTVSVGMESMDLDPERLPTGGHKFKKSKLYELSPVSIPANKHALGLTRSIEPDEFLEMLDKMYEKLSEMIEKSVSNNFNKSFEPLETRLDILESTLVVNKSIKQEVKDTSVEDFTKEISRILDKSR